MPEKPVAALRSRLTEKMGTAVQELYQVDTTAMLEKALPIIEASHRILANNVANANTPGFAPTHVSFQETLRQTLKGDHAAISIKMTHPRHFAPGSTRPGLVLERDTFGPGRNDESTFDIDREMVELLKNNGRFNILSSILTKKYQQMREVLRTQ